MLPMGGTIEFHEAPVPLDQLLPGTNRNPIASMPLDLAPNPIMPGRPTRIPLPPAPPGAQYAVLILDLANGQGQAATMDFMLLPLDNALRPVMEHGRATDSFFDIFVGDLEPGRMYRLREGMTVDSFFDVFTEISLEEGGDFHLRVPLQGPRRFYQTVLEPE